MNLKLSLHFGKNRSKLAVFIRANFLFVIWNTLAKSDFLPSENHPLNGVYTMA